jgi:hypothetical protein
MGLSPRASRYAPTTGWAAANEPGTLTCQERKMEVSIPVTVKGHRGCSKPAAAPAARLPRRRATDLNRYARALIRLRCGARALAGSLSISDLPPDKNRREMAEDGELESQRPGWFILQKRKAQYSKLTAFSRASLSGRAWRACPVHLPYPPRDSNPDVILLRDAALPVGLEGLASDRPDSSRPCELGELAC